ncbi:MAG: ACT domain-containing protein [Anaerolineae bacterium]|nr:ACT domain-containing protein [Anaerolineae bacterium]
MKATQISVFLENRPGRLLQLLQVLARAEVNLEALSIADTADFGIARVIVSDPVAAMAAIQEAGLTAATTEVLRVELPDEPGALARHVVEPLAKAGVNVEYIYAYSQRVGDRAVVVLKTDDIEKAEQVLG